MQFKQPLTACVAGALGLAFSAGAFAQDNTPQDKRFYVAPMVSYGFFQNDTVGQNDSSFGRLHIQNDNSIGTTLAIGKPVNSWLNLELYGFYFNPDQKLDGHHAGDTDLYGFGLDALFFPARDTFPVYGILGAAWGKSNPGYSSINGAGVGDDADADYLDAGVGYMYTLNSYGLKVRAEYRYRYTTVDSSDVLGDGYEDARYNDNIVSVGLQIPIGAPPQAPAPAPAPQPAPAPAPQPVQKTAPIVLKGVTFNFNKSSLTAQAQNRLNNVVNALEASPDVDFRIDGYTDSIGTQKYNLGLSQRRVDSVKSYLTDHGISTSRITGTEGHGELDPVATNKTAAGRAQNRRVELHVTNQGDSSSDQSGDQSSGMSDDSDSSMNQ